MWRASVGSLLCSTLAFAQGAVPVPDDGELPTRPADPEYLAQQQNYQDTSVTIDALPRLGARWTTRKRVRFGGVVPVALCGSKVLHVTFIGPAIRGSADAGSYERFQILPASESAKGGNCFEAVSTNPRHRGPIHAAIRVRPSARAPDSERIQVVLYHPPSRQDIVLVATRPVGETAWRPLLRIDMPRATRIDFIQPSWH